MNKNSLIVLGCGLAFFLFIIFICCAGLYLIMMFAKIIIPIIATIFGLWLLYWISIILGACILQILGKEDIVDSIFNDKPMINYNEVIEVNNNDK